MQAQISVCVCSHSASREQVSRSSHPFAGASVHSFPDSGRESMFPPSFWLMLSPHLPMNNKVIDIIVIILFSSLLRNCYCKVNASVRVHEPVVAGKSVRIDCIYELSGGSTLYSINWRFKGQEFLRLLRTFPIASSSSQSSSFSVSSPVYTTPSSSRGRQRSFRKQTLRKNHNPLEQMNGLFTPVAGIQIDVSTSFHL